MMTITCMARICPLCVIMHPWVWHASRIHSEFATKIGMMAWGTAALMAGIAYVRMQHAARTTLCNTLHLCATLCNILQHAATHCSTLQHTANALQHSGRYMYMHLQCAAMFSSVLQCAAQWICRVKRGMHMELHMHAWYTYLCTKDFFFNKQYYHLILNIILHVCFSVHKHTVLYLHVSVCVYMYHYIHTDLNRMYTHLTLVFAVCL